MKPKQITSSSNETIKEAARLRRKRNRYAQRRFLCEGEDLLAAALESGAVPRQVFLLAGAVDGFEGDLRAALEDVTDRVESQQFGARGGRSVPEVYECSEQAMGKLTELGSGSRVAAVFDFIDRPLESEGKSPPRAEAGAQETPWRLEAAPLLYLHELGDPGNVGTLIRSAVALGGRQVILSPRCADPYSSKALRATMGTIFRTCLHVDVAAGALVDWTMKADIKIVCADVRQGMPVWDVDLAGTFVLALGAEREGLPGRLKAAAREIVHIPQQESAESLNVAMAGTSILYEALRQREA